MSKPKELRNIFTNIISTQCELKVSEKDRFNMLADDRIQKKRLQLEKDTVEKSSDVIKIPHE